MTTRTRTVTYRCHDCGHCDTGDPRTAARAAMAHQLDAHDRAGYRAHTTTSIAPHPSQLGLFG